MHRHKNGNVAFIIYPFKHKIVRMHDIFLFFEKKLRGGGKSGTSGELQGQMKINIDMCAYLLHNNKHTCQ